MTTLRIDPTAPLPPYEQLQRQLIDQISAGHLPPETKLPAVRRLAADLGIAPGTVARAYKELESEGYLVTRGRNGTWVAPMGDDPARAAKALATHYVTTMRSLGFGSEAILSEVQSALARIAS